MDERRSDKIVTPIPLDEEHPYQATKDTPFRWRGKLIVPRPQTWKCWVLMLATHELGNKEEAWGKEGFEEMAGFMMRFYCLTNHQLAICKGCRYVIEEYELEEHLYCPDCKTGKHMVTLADLALYW